MSVLLLILGVLLGGACAIAFVRSTPTASDCATS